MRAVQWTFNEKSSMTAFIEHQQTHIYKQKWKLALLIKADEASDYFYRVIADSGQTFVTDYAHLSYSHILSFYKRLTRERNLP